MLIRIKQIRKLADGKPGSDIDVSKKGGPRKVLQFRPLDPKHPEVDHVCDVTDPDEVAMLISIREGYEIHSSEMDKRAAPKAAAEPATEQKQERAAAPEASAPAGGAATDYSGLSRDELLKVVAKKTGKKPSPATSKAKLLKLLAA